jgi:hypothetical protein
MALIDYNNGTATISVNGGQPPFSYLLKQGGVAATHNGANFVNPIVSSNQSVVFGDASDLTGSYGMPSGTYTCEITDNNNCVVTTSQIVISQTEEATTTQATAATTLATAATTLATIPTTLATAGTTLATVGTTLATNETTLATNETTLATNETTLATNETTLATTTLPTFTCTEAGLIVDDGITGDGLSYENVGTATSITPTSQQSGNTEYTVTITVPATNTFGTPYSNAGASIECTDFAIGTDPTTLATTTTTIATTLAPTYSLSVNSPVNEGSDMTFTLTTTGLQDNDVVPFGLGGTASVNVNEPWLGDYSPVTPTEFVITNNSATYTVTTYEDNTTESGGNETIILTLAAFDSQGNGTFSESVTGEIVDTSQTPTYNTITAQTVNEGQNMTFTLSTANVANGTTVDFAFSGTATQGTDYTVPGALQMTINNNSATYTIATTADQITDGNETVIMSLNVTDNSGNLTDFITGTGTITDTSIDPTTLATTTTAAPLNRTFYYIHAGQSTTPYTSSLTGPGPFYINGGNGNTTDLSIAMQDMIANSGNQYYGLVESFVMPQGVNITGNGNATTWSYPQTGAAEPYYIAVPDNADFQVNLLSAGVLTNLANNQPTNAASVGGFTDANGNDYLLYQLAAASSTGSSNWAFV